MLLFSDNLEDMTDTDNVAGIYLPPGATDGDDGKTKSGFPGLAEDDDKDLFGIEDDLDQLLSDVIKKPSAQKPQSSPMTTAKTPPQLPAKPVPAQRPTPAARPTARPGKIAPKPAPRKGKTAAPAAGVTEDSAKDKAADMDDGDILKYIQDNAGEEEASLDLF